jgi:hypothetical protein
MRGVRINRVSTGAKDNAMRSTITMMTGLMLASLTLATPTAAQWHDAPPQGNWQDAGWNDGRGWNDRRGWNDGRGWNNGRGHQGGWNDDRGGQYCRRSDGSTGTLVGAALGGVVGSEMSRRGSRTKGAVLGAVVGGLLGRSVDRGRVVCR